MARNPEIIMEKSDKFNYANMNLCRKKKCHRLKRGAKEKPKKKRRQIFATHTVKGNILVISRTTNQ